MTAPSFSVGDLVRWSSASRGHWRHHSGVVVAVVPAGEPPYMHRPKGARWTWCCDDRSIRRRESYLIALRDGSTGTAGRLYRPRVRHLRHASTASAGRFHSGGTVGLAPGEIPAILSHGYELRADDPRLPEFTRPSAPEGRPIPMLELQDQPMPQGVFELFP